jgi:hypothetical protein
MKYIQYTEINDGISHRYKRATNGGPPVEVCLACGGDAQTLGPYPLLGFDDELLCPACYAEYVKTMNEIIEDQR